MPPEPRVKGVAFRTIDACYLELRGEKLRERARSLMPAELSDSYYDTGSARVIESRRGHCVARLENCVGWDANMFVELHGSCVALLEIAGGKEVRIHVRSGGKDGDTATEYEAHWI